MKIKEPSETNWTAFWNLSGTPAGFRKFLLNSAQLPKMHWNLSNPPWDLGTTLKLPEAPLKPPGAP